MKKDLSFKGRQILSVMIAACLMVSVTCLSSACSKKVSAVSGNSALSVAENAGQEVVLPPETEANASLEGMLNYRPFGECIDTADLIAYVTVGNWLGESERGQGYFSFYEAVINETYKGNNSGKIILKQDGNSQAQFKGYPLFKAGDELLLFLKEAADESGNVFYYILGSYSTVLYAVYNEDGSRYFADYIGLILETAKGLDAASIPVEKFNRPDGSGPIGTPKALFEESALTDLIKEYRA